MVTTAALPSHSRYRTPPGEGYDGVVRISMGGQYATGALLFDGRAVLTSAHLFKERSGLATVLFETRAGTETRTATLIATHPGYDSFANHDLALLWLPGLAPVGADRYSLYRGTQEIGQVFNFVGYGQTGTGSAGANAQDSTQALRLQAYNRFDADASTLKAFMGAAMAWTPAPGTQLLADFDNGTATQDALGRLANRHDTGLDIDEGMMAQGDSGGPAFIRGQIAGVTSYIASLRLGPVEPDIDARTNSSFGEIGAWQRVSAHQQWIDQQMRAQYPDVPTRPEAVRTEVTEGNSGSRYTYFLVQFTGLRSDPAQILSVDYSTRDGTAQAGSDYLAASGTLRLYPGETQAVIPVEILGDTLAERDETFYLDIFNPVGGSFGPGRVMLTAMRTLLDDDGWPG